MKDDEARYLIDQLNKYASWQVTYWEKFLATLAIVVTANALVISLSPLSPTPSGNTVFAITVVLAFLVLAVALHMFYSATRSHARYSRRLILLENFRAKYHSLPESITFSEIVSAQLNEEKLREDLENAEPSITERGCL